MLRRAVARRPARGPFAALPALSRVARRALAGIAALALLGAGFLVAQAFLLAAVLAAIVAGETAGLAVLLWLLGGAVIGRALVAWATRVVAQRAAAGVKEELRGKAVDGALARGPEWIADRGPGELAAVATRGLDALDAYFTEYLPALVTASVVPVAAGVAVLVADWPSAVIVALTLPLLPVFAVLVGLHTKDRVRDSMAAMQRLSGRVLELVRALPVLTAFGRAEAQAGVVREVSQRHRRAAVETMKVAFSSAFVLELAATLSVALIAVVIGVRLVSGDLALAIGLGVLILVPECYQPIRSVGAAFHASADGVEAIRRIAAVIADPGDTDSGFPALRRRSAIDDVSVRALRRRSVTDEPSLVVSGLRIARRSGRTPAVTFAVRPRRIAWLRAASGAGKSSVLAALLGFERPAAGTITAGGLPLADWDLAQWRRGVAWVPQFPALTEPTVRDELRSAADGVSTSAIDTVVRELAIADLLDRDPATLSTGQRQRVAVARALLRVRCGGAWLLLLDEPTAHLDAHHAARVMDLVRAAAADGAAVVLAAHATPAADGGDSRELWGESLGARELCAQTRDATDPTRSPRLGGLVTGRLLAGAVLGALGLAAGIALTATSGWLIATASLQPPILTLTVAIVAVRTFGLGRAVLRYAERLVTHDAAFRTATRLRVDLWRALVRRGPAHALAAGEGQLRLVDDVDTVRDLTPRVVAPPVVAGLVALVAVAVQTAVLPLAGAVLAVAVLAGAFGAVAGSRLVERHAETRLAEGRRAVRGQVLALLDAAADLIAFDRIDRRRATLARTDARLAADARRCAGAAGVAEAAVVLSMGAAAVACTVVAAAAVNAGALAPVAAPVLALIPLALAEAIALLPDATRRAESLRRAGNRLAAALATDPVAGDDRPDPLPPGGGRSSGDPAGVALRRVTVRWPSAPSPALRGVDLRAGAGSWTAVVGESGAGKSTLLATLLGFLEPEQGTVARPSAVVWAPQDPQLVASTVAENLRLGDPYADAAAMADALRAVCLGDYAARLDLLLGSAGAGLSGGQARRLSLARALLAARRHGAGALVLLDEPTAHLDAETAGEVLAGLRIAFAGHTVIHVTHNPAEAAAADQTVEIRDGRAFVTDFRGPRCVFPLEAGMRIGQ